MEVNNIFVSVNAKSFASQSQWWSSFLGREWDRNPMQSCHEWDLRDGVLFQVLDNRHSKPATVALRVDDADKEIARLREAGIEVPEPTKVDGFHSLRYTELEDPEGDIVGLLDGE